MIIALPSIAAARCTPLPGAHALGTKALWPGGDASQAILFFEPHYALAPASKSSAILPGEIPPQNPARNPARNPNGLSIPSQRHCTLGLPATARLHAVVEWSYHCGSGGTGRRARLRILWPKGRGGSNPSFRTNLFDEERLSRANIVSRGTLFILSWSKDSLGNKLCDPSYPTKRSP